MNKEQIKSRFLKNPQYILFSETSKETHGFESLLYVLGGINSLYNYGIFIKDDIVRYAFWDKTTRSEKYLEITYIDDFKIPLNEIQLEKIIYNSI